MSQNINMSCSNRCNYYKADIDMTLFSKGVGIYMQGFKRCNTCNIFLTEDGVFVNGKGNTLCKCCKFRVTTRPRRSTAKNKLTRMLKEGMVFG